MTRAPLLLCIAVAAHTAPLGAASPQRTPPTKAPPTKTPTTTKAPATRTRVPAAPAATLSAPAHPAILKSEFLFTRDPTPSVHASTIVSTSAGLVVAWFGGRVEGATDVGIWLSRHRRGAWTAPARVSTCAEGRRRLACWNPVLFETAPGQLTLWYKSGPSPREWWGMVRTSRDGGATWSDARRLPDGQLGPIKNKPIRLAETLLIAGSSTESTDSVSKWRVHFERSTDNGRTWSVVAPASSDSTLNAIQPAILVHRGGWLQALVRTQSGRIWETWSDNNGAAWSALSPTSLPNPNAGIDAVTLHSGRHLLVYNNTATGRTPLSVGSSRVDLQACKLEYSIVSPK